MCITRNEACTFYGSLLEFLEQCIIILLAGGEVRDQSDEWDRFAVIMYDNTQGDFVFSARKWNNKASSYICQLQQQGLSVIQPNSVLY